MNQLSRRLVWATVIVGLAVGSPTAGEEPGVSKPGSAARIRQENVVQIYAVEEQPVPYLVMEYIPGQTLQQKLDQSGPLEELSHVVMPERDAPKDAGI